MTEIEYTEHEQGDNREHRRSKHVGLEALITFAVAVGADGSDPNGAVGSDTGGLSPGGGN